MAALTSHSSHNNPDDPFDTLLTLEDTLYTTAYTLGTTAGSLAGRVEGRIFGLENGFEKFAVLGALHGRGVVWASRLPSLTTTPSTTTTTTTTTTAAAATTKTQSETTTQTPPTANPSAPTESSPSLPQLAETPRLTSNTTLLHALTDPLTFSTSNTEEAVADFDDRCKRASAKAKVIERLIGENTPTYSSTPDNNNNNNNNAPSPTALQPTTQHEEKSPTKQIYHSEPKKGHISARKQNVKLAGRGQKNAGSDSMEDFAGSRFLT